MKMYKDQYIVVTGAAGFIGSCVVRILNDRGFSNIVVVDELGTKESWKNLVGKQYAEMIGKDDLFTWLKGKESSIEAFIHLGACSNTVEKDADYLMENNYRYSLRLAEYALTINTVLSMPLLLLLMEMDHKVFPITMISWTSYNL